MELVLALILKYANIYRIDYDLAIAVAQHESLLDHNRIGVFGEVGVFQLRPEFFPKEIHKLEKNIQYGIAHLKFVKEKCVHQKENTWIICYNLGIVGGKRVKHPSLFPYYRKVYAIYRERKRISRFYSVQ